ncbi:MAG: fumarylacetoacetate hydrolase family protein [Clostridiales bacterium]|jgi:2-keto-4-pentenoate hydratase/2-oxohepta-3-ene-1,7-dioic acid hydratase in catechol pathway|nr:fumarylacetoacetate hydrolase family protein [Clostridiales bacterium]
MKLCSFTVNGSTHVGVFQNGGVIDLTAAGVAESMNELIKQGSLSFNTQNLPIISEDRVKFAAVTEPSKIVCVGLNYKKHAEETGGTPPAEPVIFSKFNDALSPHASAIKLPSWQRCFDYEAELVIVMGKEAWNIPEERALDYVFGYTCGNDLSARDCQFISSQWLIGKTFPGFAPAGPYIVTADSFDPFASHRITCRRNGEIVQDSDIDDMIFNCAQLVSYISRYCRLSPGDLIFTGTPSGVVLGHEKGKRNWLKAGETISVTIEGIGTLENTLA